MRTLVALLASAALSVPLQAAEIGLSWDPSSMATGYRAYVSQSSGSYPPAAAWDGATTSAVVTVPGACVQNFAVITAYNAAGESGASDEVSFTARPKIDDIGAGPSTWLITGDGFTPGLSLYIYTVDDPTIPLDLPHTLQDCAAITVPVVSIPASPEYFKMRICTNGGLVCSDFLLIPQAPANVTPF